MFENKVLRRTLGFKQEDVSGEFRILLNKEFHDLYR
jgi:hypothetical protein